MKLIALCEGGVKCSSACPHYAESGVVDGFGGPIKTVCGQVMEPIYADCSLYNPRLTRFVDGMTPEQWKQLVKVLKGLGLKPRKVRKQYRKDHREIHHIGDNTRCPKAAKINRKIS